MSARDIDEYLQSERYAKYKAKTLIDLHSAMENLKSADAAVRRKGANRINYHSRRELGVGLLFVREWFLDEKSRNELSLICRDESDEKVLQYLLSAFKFVPERYITHPVWEEIYSVEDETQYKKWLLFVAEGIKHPSFLVRAEIAYILALYGNERAWDIYNEVLPRKSAYCGWFRVACFHYAKDSMTKNQQADLINTLNKILHKVKNPSVRRDAAEAKIMIEKI